MTDTEFNAICAQLGLPGIQPTRKRHTVYVGSKSVTYFETTAEAEAEVARLKAAGHTNVRIRTHDF